MWWHSRPNRNAYRILVRKPEGKRQFGRPKHKWEDTIKMDLKEIRCGGVEWIHLAQNRDQWQPLSSIKRREFHD
jgi:hypothetical protein